MEILPHNQGDLDGLCGIYSIINALRIIFPGMKEKEATDLFKKVLKYLEQKKKLSSVIVGGLYCDDMQRILDDVIQHKYPVFWWRQFYRRRGLTLDKFWNELYAFLTDEKQVAVILSLENAKWEHWSVIDKISPKQICLFDSSGLNRINQRYCALNKRMKGKTIAFIPKETFFISIITEAASDHKTNGGKAYAKKRVKKAKNRPGGKSNARQEKLNITKAAS